MVELSLQSSEQTQSLGNDRQGSVERLGLGTNPWLSTFTCSRVSVSLLREWQLETLLRLVAMKMGRLRQ